MGTKMYSKLVLVLLIGIATIAQSQSLEPAFDDNIAVESILSQNIEKKPISSSILPNNIFNDGKPFYVEKDPISGTINFNSKKSNNLDNYGTDELLLDDKKSDIAGFNSNDISQISSNFHDYLNLPVKYTSSKFVYPLVSSSYSNLKYQGNNKNFTSNHKNYTATPIKVETTTRGGYKDNHRPTSYTLKPKPISTAPLKFSSVTVKPNPTTNYYDFFKKDKFTKTIPKTITSVKETPATSNPPITSTTPSSTTKSQQTTIKSSTQFSSSISTSRKPFIFESLPTTIPLPSTTEKAIALSDLFNVLGVEEPSNDLQIDNHDKELIKVNLNALNGPLNPQNISLTSTKPSSTFTIPKLPTVKPKPTQQPENEKRPADPVQQTQTIKLSANQSQTQQSHVTQFPQQNNVNYQYTQSQQQPTHQQGHEQHQESLHHKHKPHQNIQHPNQHQHPQQQNPQQPQLQFPHQQHHFLHQNPQNLPLQAHQQLQNHLKPQENNFVQYEIQTPSQSGSSSSISSMNNIIISPDQNSAAFVLGSHQSFDQNGFQGNGEYVGSASEDRPYVNTNGLQYELNTVLSEPSSSEFKPQGFIPSTSDAKLQENQVGSIIRFPTESFENSQIVTGSPKTEIRIPNLSLPQSQIVVFPPNEKMPTEIINAELDFNKKPDENRVVFEKEKEILSMNSQPSLHQLPEDLTPPLDSYNYGRLPYSPNPNPNQAQSDRLNFNRPPPPPQFAFNELTRKPGFTRFPPDQTLPNILPQFRPNAKESHGHPPYNKDASSIRLPNGQNIRIPPYRKPSQNNIERQQQNRRNPNQNQVYGMNPNRFNNKMAPAMMAEHMEPNRRFYRVPTQPQIMDRIFGPPVPPVPYVPSRRYSPDIHPQNQRINSLTNNQVDPKIDRIHNQLPPFENDDFFKHPPILRRPAINDQKFENQPILQEQPKLEPVVTLQMIQSKKNSQQDQQSLPVNDNQMVGSSPIQSTGKSPPVYVVYPIKSAPMKLNVITPPDSEDPVVIGQRGDHPPLPPSEISSLESKNDYQNTPFTIVHNEQEPILMAKDKPHQKPLKVHFPYRLEKPDPLTIAELDRQSHIKKGQLNDFEVFNTGEAPIDAIPKVVNKGNHQDLQFDDIEEDEDLLYGKGTRTPIAIAYTPTQPPQYYNNYDKYSSANYNGPVIAEFLDENENENYPAFSNDEIDELGFPSRGENYEQDFQAPFYPSVSLGGNVVKNEYEGWSIIAPSSTQSSVPIQKQPLLQSASPISATLHQKHQINRSDVNNVEQKIQTLENFHNSAPLISSDEKTTQFEATTKPFNLDTFQPMFEGGFRPIIPPPQNLIALPPNIKTPDEATTTESNNQKFSTTLSTITPPAESALNFRPNRNETNVEPPTTKKSVFESSLAELFGLTDDDDENDDSTARSS